MTERVRVARIGAAHGVRGEVKLWPFTQDPLGVTDYGPLETENGTQRFEIETLRAAKDHLVVRLKGIADRNAAEALRNTLLITDVDPDETPEEPDEYYDHQLVDLDVVTRDGIAVGRIAEISHLPSQDLFIVRRPDGGEVMIPFVEEIVTEIDLAEQRAVIDPPPGLIDDRAILATGDDTAATGGDTASSHDGAQAAEDET